VKIRTFIGVLCAVPVLIYAAPAARNAVSGTTAGTEISWSDDEAELSEIGTKQVIGMAEKVLVEPGGIILDARIDTGANKTSLGAENLQIVKEDGQDWALFSVNGNPVRTKVVKYVRIKQHGAPSQRRPVVRIKVTLGNVTQIVLTTLTDRSNFKYKILIGVNFLKDHFIVDVSRKYSKEPVGAP
jgi:hypothetical protein